MKKLAALTLSLFLSVGTAFADSPTDSPKDTPKASDAQPAKSPTAAKPAGTKTNAEIAAEMEELRQALQAQQEQLQTLKEELAKRDREIEAAREAAAAANARATEANVKATEAAATSNEVKSTTSALNSSVATLTASSAAASNAGNAAPVNVAAQAASSGQGNTEEKGPMTIRYKGVSFTPGGFVAAETVFRNKAASADIATPFTSIPYPGNSLSKVTEFNMTGRQSRVSMKVDAGIGSTKVSGYVEADFLGAGTTSNNRQTNSYVLRQRQFWGRAELESGWTFTGGQMWSLVTENRKGIANLTEATPMMIDPNYVVGFTWARQDAFRVTKTLGDKFTVAASVEGSQATIGGRGFTTYTNTTATGVVTTFQNFWVDAPGSSAGLYNAFDPTGYSPNKLPDFIVKAAFDPGLGHYEVFGVISEFRNRVYPCAVVGTTAKNFPTPAAPVAVGCGGTVTSPSAAGAYNNSSTGGGVGASALVPLFAKRLDVGVSGLWGDATGRYGAAQISDVTAKPFGTLVGIHNAQWLGRLEWHATPKLDLYAYFGGEYGGRAAYSGYYSAKVTATPAIPGCGGVGQQPCPGGGVQPSYPALTTTAITTNGIGGYGNKLAVNTGCSLEVPPAGTSAPGAGGTCAGDVRYIAEGTFGFWQKFYQGEKGRLQWGIQYSYLYKVGWSGAGGLTPTSSAGIAPKAIDNMVWTSFRYYLP